MITQDEFVQLLSKYSGNIDLSTSTKLKMNKGGRGGVDPNPFYEKDVRKVKISTYEVGANYCEKINEALKAHFYNNEVIDDMLKVKEQLVLNSKQSSFMAANDVLDYYFNKR